MGEEYKKRPFQDIIKTTVMICFVLRREFLLSIQLIVILLQVKSDHCQRDFQLDFQFPSAMQPDVAVILLEDPKYSFRIDRPLLPVDDSVLRIQKALRVLFQLL